MPKCPRCGSTAQVQEWNVDYCYGENGEDEILVFCDYHCGCGCNFTGTRTYRIDGEEKIEEGQCYETSNYLYVSHSQMYGMLHGMNAGGCLRNVTLADAKEIAHTEAYDVVTGYMCIMSDIYDDLNYQFGYDETPEEPDEEYLDALEDAIQEECEYSLFEITPEGEAHWDKMEEDYESYEDHLKAGWLIPIDERSF